MIVLPSRDILGTPIASIGLEGAVAFVEDAIQQGERTYVCVCSVNNVMTARHDPELARSHKEAALCVADGWPLAKLVRRRFPGTAARVRGRDLVLALAGNAVEREHSIFLYGAAPGVPERMAANLVARHPSLRIVGVHSPPFRPMTPEEDEAEVRRINEADPDIVLVGLSTPKQEKWMRSHRDRIGAPVLVGVGAAFDFVGGTKKPPPDWVSNAGLEWAWRFAQEPRRLWRRVLIQGPAFLALLAWESLTRRGEGRRGSDQEV